MPNAKFQCPDQKKGDSQDPSLGRIIILPNSWCGETPNSSTKPRGDHWVSAGLTVVTAATSQWLCDFGLFHQDRDAQFLILSAPMAGQTGQRVPRDVNGPHGPEMYVIINDYK